jgi:hypothetical protein
MDKLKREDELAHVYGTTTYAKIGTFLFIFLLLVGVVYFKDYEPLRSYAVVRFGWPIIVLVLIYCCFVFLIDGTQQHLAIYSTGLEHRQGTLISFTTWENLSHFDNVKGFPCIVTKAEIERSSKGQWLERFLITHVSGNLIRLPRECGIPVHFVEGKTGTQVDVEKLLKTNFGQDLLHYAPHLFETKKEKAKNS